VAKLAQEYCQSNAQARDPFGYQAGAKGQQRHTTQVHTHRRGNKWTLSTCTQKAVVHKQINAWQKTFRAISRPIAVSPPIAHTNWMFSAKQQLACGDTHPEHTGQRQPATKATESMRRVKETKFARQLDINVRIATQHGRAGTGNETVSHTSNYAEPCACRGSFISRRNSLIQLESSHCGREATKLADAAKLKHQNKDLRK
jgi:hypothetical protein